MVALILGWFMAGFLLVAGLLLLNRLPLLRTRLFVKRCDALWSQVPQNQRRECLRQLTGVEPSGQPDIAFRKAVDDLVSGREFPIDADRELILVRFHHLVRDLRSA